MSGAGDRLFDVRRRPTFHVDLSALSHLPEIGPAAWAVYCFLVARTAEGESVWPNDLAIASACGISTYNARMSINTLMDRGLIASHHWTGEEDSPVVYAILPSAFPLGVAHVQPDEPIVRDTDRLVSEDSPGEQRWQQEARERNATRELFRQFLTALDVDPADLSEQARRTVTEASRLARAAGATPDDVRDLINRIRVDRPELVADAERMLAYWHRLFEELDEDTDPGSKPA